MCMSSYCMKSLGYIRTNWVQTNSNQHRIIAKWSWKQSQVISCSISFFRNRIRSVHGIPGFFLFHFCCRLLSAPGLLLHWSRLCWACCCISPWSSLLSTSCSESPDSRHVFQTSNCYWFSCCLACLPFLRSSTKDRMFLCTAALLIPSTAREPARCLAGNSSVNISV